MTAQEFIELIQRAYNVNLSAAVPIAADLLKVNHHTPWKWLSGKFNPSKQTLVLMEILAEKIQDEATMTTEEIVRVDYVNNLVLTISDALSRVTADDKKELFNVQYFNENDEPTKDLCRVSHITIVKNDDYYSPDRYTTDDELKALFEALQNAGLMKEQSFQKWSSGIYFEIQ